MSRKSTPSARRQRAVSPFLPQGVGTGGQPGTRLHSPLADMPEDEPISGPLVLASDLPVRVAGVRIQLTQQQIDQALQFMQTLDRKEIDELARNSRRGMRADWRHWIAYCAQRDRQALPILFDDLTDFIDALIDAGYKRATLEHILYTLDRASVFWGCPSPTGTREWKAYWRSRCRTHLQARQRQAQPLKDDDLARMLDGFKRTDPRSIRDVTIALCAYDLLARVSEVVSMRWENLNLDDDGSASYVFGRTKTDQEGVGVELALSPETAEMLHLWKAHCDPANPYIFHALPRGPKHQVDTTRPLNVREIPRILDRLARTYGIAKTLSGHSGRVGAAQDLVGEGYDLPFIMQQGRWKSQAMPARYAERELAKVAGKRRFARLRKGRQR